MLDGCYRLSDITRINEVETAPYEGSELEAQQKHAELLEKVIRFGLSQSQYLIDVQVRP